jgi:hypothetical protein
MIPKLDNSSIKAAISHTGPLSGIVTARFETCEESICTIKYVQVDTAFVIIALALHPSLSKDDATRAGDACDAALAVEAQKRGVTQLLMCPPNETTAVFVREYTIKQSVTRLSYPSTAATASIN